eukprot:3164857-Amphidinium_carterae.1
MLDVRDELLLNGMPGSAIVDGVTRAASPLVAGLFSDLEMDGLAAHVVSALKDQNGGPSNSEAKALDDSLVDEIKSSAGISDQTPATISDVAIGEAASATDLVGLRALAVAQL